MLPVGRPYSPSHSRYDDDEEGRVYGDFEEDEEYDDEEDEDEDEEDLDDEYDDLEDEFEDEDDEPRRGRRSDWDEG